MLTKLVARNEAVSETPLFYRTEFEHEHRCAEHDSEHGVCTLETSLARETQ